MSESNKPKDMTIPFVLSIIGIFAVCLLGMYLNTLGEKQKSKVDYEKMANATDWDKQKCKDIVANLSSVGITEIKRVRALDIENGYAIGIWADYDTSYRVELTGDKIISRVFIPLDSLFCNYLLVYSKENGRAVDSTLDGNYAEIELNVENYSEQWIEENLKSPSTAEFGNRSIRTDGEYFEIKGYVDSQNGLGATLRSTYSVQSKIEISSSSNGEKYVNYIPVYINIDNKFIKGEQVNIEENLVY